MRSAICPQPSKRFQFNNHKEGTKDKMNKLIKVISISTILFVISAFLLKLLAKVVLQVFLH